MLSLSTNADMPVTADGCQTMKSDCPASLADLKYASQSMPGALTVKSVRFHALFCLKTSAASESGAKVRAIRVSNDKIRPELASVPVKPASFNTAAMCAWYL